MASTVRVISIKLPNSMVARAANKSAAHRALVNHALKHNLQPVFPLDDEIDAFTTVILGDMEAKLQAMSQEKGMTIPHLFGALAKAGLLDSLKTEKKEERTRGSIHHELSGFLLTSPLEEDRPPQKEFWQHVATGLSLNKIVLAEASTGVGKGRVIVSAAVMSIKQGKGPVIIAGPTLQVVGQLWEEFEKDVVQADAHDIRAAILPGQQEFVDDLALREYLLDAPDEKVQAWVDGGGQSETGGAISRAGKRFGKPLLWLMEDLRAIATNFRAEDFALSEKSKPKKGEPEPEALQQMMDLRASVAEAQIVFCTHAMLAISTINGWQSLPVLRKSLDNGDDDTESEKDHPVFLIDEAHLFETALSNAKSQDLSLYSLRHRLRSFQRASGLKSQSSVGKAAEVVNQITKDCAILREEDRICLTAGEIPEQVSSIVKEQILPKLIELSSLLNKKGGIQEIKGIDQDRQAIVATIKTLIGKSNDRTYLVFSPDKRFPSFQTGASSVNKELGRLWEKAKGGAALISASFFVPETSGRLTCDHMRTTLHLPLLRMDTPTPVLWDEIYTAPTLHIPSSESAKDLIPPTNGVGQKEWIDAQAKVINQIASDAAGGTLVLCTAYSQIAGLAEALKTIGLPSSRLVVHSGHMPSSKLVFEKLARQGVRPVWLSLGAAWTGLDVREGKDVPPKKDKLLTDLVITRIPVGLNRSNTMMSRMDRIGFRPVAQEALLLFKQGLGRPIRRAGLVGRRIWILDGRMQHAPTRFMADLMASVFSMLTKYKKRSSF